jgi:putative photosynthetic complex assembly protein 2
MSEYLMPASCALLVWWLSTALVLYLDGLPRRTFPWSLAIASIVAIIALAALYLSAQATSVVAAYVAFASAIALWGWHELTFLTGLITGPRKTPSVAPPSRWQHAREATQTLIYHEVAVALTVVLAFALTYGQPNHFGTWTIAALWLMRLSSKFNLFLGARNLGEELLPAHLQYLKTFMRRRAMNPLFPFSILLGAAATSMAAWAALNPAASAHTSAGYSLLATILALGVLEHVLLMLPISSTALWRWGLRSHARPPTPVSGVS